MTATPKPRAGEHVPGRRFSSRYPEGIGGDYYMQPDPIKELEAERDSLRERERELVEALQTISSLALSPMVDMGDPPEDQTRDWAHVASLAWNTARAALAKVRP